MKCMICGAPATVFVTQTVNGRTRQQFLCDSCARQRENGLYIQSRQRQRQKQNTVCPKCGTRLDEFLKTGFLGCPECYDAFSEQMQKILPKIQGKTRHVPRKHIVLSPAEQVADLKAQLDAATRERRYDEAEIIYRKLKEMGEI